MAKTIVSTDLDKAIPKQVAAQKFVSEQTLDGLREEQQLNVWIPKDLMKRLKLKGIENDQSMKEIVIEALNQFL